MAHRTVPPFLVLLAQSEAAMVARILARSAPAGALRVLNPGLGATALVGEGDELDRWWERSGGSRSRPVVIVEHHEELPGVLPRLDAEFVVGVSDAGERAAYARLANVRPAPARDPRGLARAALEAAGLRPGPAPAGPPPDPFALLAELGGTASGPEYPLPAAGPGGPRAREPRELAALGQALLTGEPLLAVVVSPTGTGGAGKTASAAALAATFGEALAPFGRTAALVDANLGNPATWDPPARPPAVPRLIGQLKARHAAIVADLSGLEVAPSAAWVGEADAVVVPTAAHPAALLAAAEYLQVESLRGKPAVVACIVPRRRRVREARRVRRLGRQIAARAAVAEVPDDAPPSQPLHQAYVTLAARTVEVTGRGTPADPLRDLSFCLLYDLCAWLAGDVRAVDTDAYRLRVLRDTAEPGRRLAAYLEPSLLKRWQEALAPFLARRAALQPEIGEVGTFCARGQTLAELRFQSRSHVLDGDGRAHPLPPSAWALWIRLGPDLSRVADAGLRRGLTSAPGSQRSPPSEPPTTPRRR